VFARQNADGSVTTDRRQIAFIKISKALSAFTAHGVKNISRRGPTTLHRGRRDAGHRFAVALQYRQIPDDEHLRMAGDAEIVIHFHAPASISRRPERRPER
jgi:hypothetical protein